MIDINQVSEMTQVRTAGYRPPVMSRPSFGSVGLPSFNLNSVEWMRRDPQIRLGMAIKKAPYHKVRLSIKGSPEVVQYVSEMVRRFWSKALPRVMNGFWYTMSGGEIINKENKRTGDLEFWNYQDIYPSDLFILSQGSTPVGVSVNMRGRDTEVPQNQVSISNSDGADNSRLRLFFPKGFLYIHQREFNSLSGISEFEAAYAPWLEKNDYLGARHSRKLWFYKNAFNGGIMFCPPGNYVTEDNQKIPYRDLAQQTLEQASNGAVFTIEQKFDPVSGQPLWSYQEPKINPGGRELLDYLHDLDTEELRGLGIPDDVVSQASGGGGSFSGRTIPLMSFFISQEETLSNMFTVCDEQVFRPNCRNKFGDDDYEASMSIDIDRLMGVMNAGDVGSPNEGDGGQSPQDQADQQQGVSPSEKQPGSAQMSLTTPDEMKPLLSSITDAYNDKGPKVRVEMDTGGKIYAIKWGEPIQFAVKKPTLGDRLRAKLGEVHKNRSGKISHGGQFEDSGSSSKIAKRTPEQQALLDWTDTSDDNELSYKQIREYQITGKTNNPDVRKASKLIDSALEKIPPTTGPNNEVYRGLSLDKDSLEDFLNKYAKGKSVSNNAVSSFSDDEDAADEFARGKEFRVKMVIQGKVCKKIPSTEGEYALPRNTRLKVLSLEQSENNIHVILSPKPTQMARKAFDETKHARAKKTVVIKGVEYLGGRWIPSGDWQKMTEKDKDKVLDRHPKESTPAYGRRMAEHPRRVARGEEVDNPHGDSKSTKAQPKISKTTSPKNATSKESAKATKEEHGVGWHQAIRINEQKDDEGNITALAKVVIVDEEGNHTDTAIPEWIEPGFIMPAWCLNGKTVQISIKKDTAVWVKGKDSKDRTQEKRNPKYLMQGEIDKFKRVSVFSTPECFDEVMGENSKDQDSQDENIRAAADCLYLINIQGTRAGSGGDSKDVKKYFKNTMTKSSFGKFQTEDENGELRFKTDGTPSMAWGYKKGKVAIRNEDTKKLMESRMSAGQIEDVEFWMNTWGASNMQARHVVIQGKEVRLQFMSKESKWHDHLIKDKKLKEILIDRKQTAPEPNSPLFGKLTYEKLGDQISRISQKRFSAKDFRTLQATRMATAEIKKIGPKVFKDFESYKEAVNKIGEKVSELLGNNVDEAVGTYINPNVWHTWKCPEADYSMRLKDVAHYEQNLKSNSAMAQTKADKAKKQAEYKAKGLL